MEQKTKKKREGLFQMFQITFVHLPKKKAIEISVSRSCFFLHQSGMRAGKYISLSNGMRVKYLDISQTFFQDFSFHVTVVFFIVVNWNTRVLLNLHPPYSNLCALCKKPIGCHQSSQA